MSSQRVDSGARKAGDPPGGTTIGRPRSAARWAATAEANRPSAHPTPATMPGTASLQRLAEARRQTGIAAEVAGRTTGVETQQARCDHVDPRGEPADRARDRLESEGIAIGIVVEQHGVGAAALGGAPPLPDLDAFGCCRGRPGDHPVGVQDDRRFVVPSGGDDRPVGTPDREDPPHAGRSSGGICHLIAPAGSSTCLDGFDPARRCGQPQGGAARPRPAATGGDGPHPAAGEVTVTVAEPGPLGVDRIDDDVGREPRCVPRRDSRAGWRHREEHGAAGREALEHPPDLCRPHAWDRRDDQVEPVDHRSHRLDPGRGRGARADSHQPFEWHTELGCRFHLQPGDVDQRQPGAVPDGLGSEGDGKGGCRRTTARHHLTPHQHGFGPAEQ